jgi:hypothetical protein
VPERDHTHKAGYWSSIEYRPLEGRVGALEYVPEDRDRAREDTVDIIPAAFHSYYHEITALAPIPFIGLMRLDLTLSISFSYHTAKSIRSIKCSP